MNLYQFIITLYKTHVDTSKVCTKFVLLATPNDPTRFDAVHCSHTKRFHSGHINRGYTSYKTFPNTRKEIRSVVYHQNGDRGIVAFHELYHAMMFANSLHIPRRVLQTPWGEADYIEMICEVFGNIMTTRCKQNVDEYLRRRMKVYRSQAHAIIRCIDEKTVLETNFISYLCGTYIILQKMMRADPDLLQWRTYARDPFRMLTQDF